MISSPLIMNYIAQIMNTVQMISIIKALWSPCFVTIFPYRSSDLGRQWSNLQSFSGPNIMLQIPTKNVHWKLIYYYFFNKEA